MNLKKTVLILMACSVFALIFSCKKESQTESAVTEIQQQQIESRNDDVCGAIMYADAASKARMEEMEHGVQQRIAQMSSTARRTDALVNIPVVFHVVWNLAEQNISDAQLLSQINVLNKDFSATNTDLSSIPSAFQPLIGNAQIHFVMAARDPQGNATNGITRTYSSVTSFSSDGSVCYTSLGGYNAWPASQYLNIWVCKKSGAAGYSSYPWSGSSATDGIIVGYNYVGTTGTFTNNWNYLLGRTVTHEVGHWLGLIHIWGDTSCGDDLVGDTPTQSAASGSCPIFPHMSACSPNSNGDMFMNYMDYSYDACRTMFTIAQTARMRGYLDGTRASIETSLGGTPPNQAVCNIPTGLIATSVTSNSAIVSWASTGAVSYNLQYKPSTSSTWTTLQTTGLSVSLSSLTASTTYQFEVQSICSSGSSSYSSVSTFVTQTVVQPCNIPSGLVATSITSSGAILSWGSTGAISYIIHYRATGSTVWTSISTASASISVSALAANTYYEFQVQGVCSTGSSAYSSSTTFKTAKRGGRQVTASIAAY
jgi:hypothetical protein